PFFVAPLVEQLGFAVEKLLDLLPKEQPLDVTHRSSWGPRMAPRPPSLGRGPAEPWRATGLAQRHSSELVPARCFHELAPAPIEAALVVLARVGHGHVGDRARQRQAMVLEGARRAAQAHLVVIRMLVRDGAAAGLVSVVPVLHV